MTDPTVDARTEAALRDLGGAIDWPTPVDFTARLRLDQAARTTWRPECRLVGRRGRSSPGHLARSRRHGRRWRTCWRWPESASSSATFPICLSNESDARCPGRHGGGSRAVDFPILVPSALRPPDRRSPLAMGAGHPGVPGLGCIDRLPEVGDSGIGLLLAEFRADLDEHFFKRSCVEGRRSIGWIVDGVPAFWLAGAPHVFMFETGGPISSKTRPGLTGNVLVWEADGITYRLESNLARRELARSPSPWAVSRSSPSDSRSLPWGLPPVSDLHLVPGLESPPA